MSDRAILERLARASEAIHDAFDRRDQLIRDAREQGVPVGRIAQAVGLTRRQTQRILGGARTPTSTDPAVTDVMRYT